MRMKRIFNIVELPQSPTLSWRLGIRMLPHKPRYVVIGIQTDKPGNLDHNASLFDHSKMVNMSVVLNSTKYSTLDANASFTKYHLAQFYKSMTAFTHDYHGMDPSISGSAIYL